MRRVRRSLGFVMLASCAARLGAGEPVRVVHDVAYQTEEPAMKGDLHLPASLPAKRAHGAVLWMHGNHHDKSDGRERVFSDYVASEGYVCLNINYGTWPESDVGEEHNPRHLQNIANARSGVAYLKAHAGEYGYRKDQVAVFGGSAGAWLSLMIGLTSRQGEIAAIGDFYGDLDAWLKSEIGPGAPPVLIVQGKADPAVDYHDSIWLADRLEALHVPHELVLLEGVGHGFDLATWQHQPLPRDLRPVVLAFLREYVGR